MKDPRNILTKPAPGIMASLIATAIPSALIMTTMFYSVTQLNSAGERETALLDSMQKLSAVIPAGILPEVTPGTTIQMVHDTLTIRDTVNSRVTVRDTIISRSIVHDTVRIPAKPVNYLLIKWLNGKATPVEGSSTDKEVLIKRASAEYPQQRERLTSALRERGYFQFQIDGNNSLNNSTRPVLLTIAATK